MSETAIDGVNRRSMVARALRHPSFLIGAAITLTLLAAALVSFVWTPFPVAEVVIRDRLQPPNPVHWLGTDAFGRDIFSMLLVGARNSLGVAVVAVAIGIGIGVPLGLAAAAEGGLLDSILMRGSDLVFAFPALVTAVMITAIFGPGAINAMIAIGIFNVPVFARVTRGAARALWGREFVLAARVAGKTRARITVEHVLPNVASLIIVQSTIQFALAILAEAGLSYVGLGTQPPMPSWGKMLADAQTMMAIAPWLAIVPGLAIVASVLGLNLLGDGLRDVLDPRLDRTR
ncbi:ABC transporter permease [Amorphus coralli]|uniref:ABC transporter permease n=1 Tax=Amorphus coralli TaxID=340680 RepID=UPI00036734BB|nr:ABC transporter permease [Amorphus coralli]